MRISDWSSDVCSSDLRVHENVRVYWQDGAGLAQVMASGEVSVAWAWNETPVTMQAEGHPVAMKRDTKEGLSTWVCGYYLLAGGQGNEEKVYDYINAFLDDDTAEYLVTEWGSDRKSVVEGKSGSVRVASGGRRNIKKNI